MRAHSTLPIPNAETTYSRPQKRHHHPSHLVLRLHLRHPCHRRHHRVVFIGYLAIRPKLPILHVHAARLDDVVPNQDAVLALRLIVVVKAENHNLKAHVSFYNTRLVLGYHGINIAELEADPFYVRKNSTIELDYVVESSSIPLDPPEQETTEVSLGKTKVMPFVLKGNSRTRWRVGPLGSLKFWLHINCHMWLPINNTVVHPHCSTTSH